MVGFARWLGLALSLLALPARAEDAAGDWIGTLDFGASKLRLAVQIVGDPGRGYTAVLTSPDQGDIKTPASEVTATAGTLKFLTPSIAGRYQGAWDAGRKAWVGVWNQRGRETPLALTRGVFPPRPTVEGVDGDWSGRLDLGATGLRLVLHVRTTPASGTVASVDSPDQGAAGLPVSSIARDGQRLRVELIGLGALFEGEIAADGQSIGGTWTQGGAARPLTFTRGAAFPAARPRPQLPERPYPYREEEVAYDNPAAYGVRLAGTLTLPPGKGPFPAVVLISGSGGQDRDETLAGHKPFLILADHLTRKGLAVLRFDDRGVSGSTGDHRKATTADFVTDTLAGVAFLRGRPEIDARRIGLVGHSEGGLIAPAAAALDPQIAFIVLMAGPGQRLEEVLIAQQRAIGLTQGMTEANIERMAPVVRRIMAAAREAPDGPTALARARFIAARDAPEMPVLQAENLAVQYSSDWMRFALAYDPKPALAAVRAPILAINGSKDLQVDAKANLAAIKAATVKNRDVTVRELEGLNHLFQTAPTGAPFEYARIEETMAPLALETISGWILKRAEGR